VVKLELRTHDQLFFSLDRKVEKTFRLGCWAVFLLLLAVLVVFWEELRNPAHVEAMYHAVAGTGREQFFRAVTFLGDDEGFMLIVVLVHWCINKSVGFWTMVALLVSGGINFTVKEIAGLPRPDIAGVVQPDNPAFPSGHTFSSLTTWGHLAARFRRPDFWVISIFIVLLIGLSRLFLGFHFPGDVLGGLVMGYLFLLLFFKLWIVLVPVVEGWSFATRLVFVLAGIFLAAMAVTVFPLLADLIMILGFLAGGSLGYVLERQTVGFIARGSLLQHLCKMLLGGTGLALVVMLLVPAVEGSNTFTFLSFSLASFWAFYLAPLLFVRLKLG